MGKGDMTSSLRLGRRRLPPLSVPGELFDLYQPRIGSAATLLWLNLRWLIQQGEDMSDPEEVLGRRYGLGDMTGTLGTLIEFELLERDDDGSLIVHEPLSADAFFVRFERPGVEQPPLPAIVEPSPLAASAAEGPGRRQSEPVPTPEPAATQQPDAGENSDLGAVMQIYHKKIGMIGPSQFERLRFWVEDQKMDAEVVALAIEETVTSAKNPRINYLEGILKNWYNAGIRTLTDLMNDKQASLVLLPKEERKKLKEAQAASPREGVANASAYEQVNPDLVERWKELYPDEYDE